MNAYFVAIGGVKIVGKAALTIVTLETVIANNKDEAVEIVTEEYGIEKTEAGYVLNYSVVEADVERLEELLEALKDANEEEAELNNQ